jgi:hypothetical protein
MADQNDPSGLPTFEIPDFKGIQKKKEEEKKKKGGAAGWSGGAARAGGIAGFGGEGGSGMGLLGRLLSLVPGMSGAGMGPVLAMMGLAGLVAMGSIVGMQGNNKGPKKARKVVVGDVEQRDSAPAQDGSSLGMLSGANSSSGMFDEAKPKKEEPKKEEPAKPDASAEAPAQAPMQANAVAQPQADAQQGSSDPFGGRRLGGGKFGALSGGAGGGGGLGKFGPKGISKDGINGGFKGGNFAKGGGTTDKLSAMKPATGPRVTAMARRNSQTGSALRRASAFSQSAAHASSSENAAYNAQSAFEPGAAAGTLAAPGGGVGGGDDSTPSTPGLTGDGSGGGGGTGGGAPKVDTPPPDPGDVKTPWADVVQYGSIIFGILIALTAVCAALSALQWPWFKAAAAIIMGICLALAAIMTIIIAATCFYYGQTALGGLWTGIGAVCVTGAVLAFACSGGTAIALAGVAALVAGFGMMIQGLISDSVNKQEEDWKEDNNPQYKKFHEWTDKQTGGSH